MANWTALIHVFVLFSSLVCMVRVSAQLGASFGEACGEDVHCDPRALLSCMDNTCQCIKPAQMKFDKEKQKCLVISKEKCAYSKEEKLDCVQQAVCNNDGNCECNNGYFRNEEGLCIIKRVGGENCSTDGECRSDLHLRCKDNICSCSETKTVFDPARSKCVFLAGVACSYYDDTCVKNSRCSYVNGGPYQCICRDNFKKTQGGLCLRNFGEYCDNNDPCSNELVCINNRCNCHFPTHQFYDSKIQQCVSKIHGPCLEAVDGQDLPQPYPCVANAQCENSTGINECTCKTGFIQSAGRMCHSVHGQPCQTSDNCDKLAGLQCREGKCSCPGDFQIYVEKLGKCQGKVGAVCDSGKNGLSCYDKESECQMFRDPQDGKGICRCRGFFNVSADRLCH